MEEKHCLNLTQLDGTLDPKLEIKCWEFLQVRISLLMKQYPELSENTVCQIIYNIELGKLYRISSWTF